MKPLFVPLNSKPYDDFEKGIKAFEFRRYKAPWTEKNCWIGRPVILSRGYGKKNRISGVITSFERIYPSEINLTNRIVIEEFYPGWIDAGGCIAIIGIKVLPLAASQCIGVRGT